MIEKVRLLTTQNPHFKGHTPLKAKENNSAATPAISKGISIYEKGSSIKFANSIMFTGLASATERLRQHMLLAMTRLTLQEAKMWAQCTLCQI